MKLALVTPRYGAEIVAGAEHACRLFAERLSRRHDVEVLTTCARDTRWRNDLSAGSDRVRGVLVRRFTLSQGQADPAEAREPGPAPGREGDLAWLRRRGPWSPALHDHLSRQHAGYDALVYFSLLQPAAAHGCAVAPGRSIVFPCLDTSHPRYLALWRDLLESVRAVGYVSEAERHLVRRYLGATPAAEEVVGIGVADPAPFTYPRHQQDPADDPVAEDGDESDGEADEADTGPAPEYLDRRGVPFRRRLRIYGRMATYVGRAEPDSGFEELFEYFASYAEGGADTTFGVFGPKLMRVPDAPFVRMEGILADRQRMAAYEAADVALVPAAGDVLGLPLLESLAAGTPVLASARNRTAVEYCTGSNAGLYYATRAEFVEAMRLLMGDDALRAEMGENGRDYVRRHHRWDAVIGRFEHLATLAARR